ncbi:MAG: hypothetical protein ACNYPH_04825 [Gammaproteobacteria bacterium WSBS_2016_MAG_OTU1]
MQIVVRQKNHADGGVDGALLAGQFLLGCLPKLTMVALLLLVGWRRISH